MLRPLAVLSLLLTLQGPPPEQPAAVPVPETSDVVTRVELAVEALDRKGAPGVGLIAGDFTVVEEGAPRRVVSVGPLHPPGAEPPWEIVVYVDRVLAGTRSVRAAAGALAERIPDLVAAGAVELVIAEPEPRVVLPATREAGALDEALSRLVLSGEGRDDLSALRRRYRERTAAEAPGSRSEDLAAEALAAEVRLVSRQQDRMLEWLAGREGGAPRALLLVSDGYDRDPAAFYRGPGTAAGTVPSPTSPALERTALETSRTAAALGWTVLPLRLGDEKLPELRRWGPRSSPEVPIGIGVKVGRRRGAADEEEEKRKKEEAAAAVPVMLAPQEPLRFLAEASGGELLVSRAAVAAAVPRLRSRLKLVYESPRPAVPEAPADGRARAVAVQAANPEIAVRARRWDVSGTPDEIAALRGRKLLSGEDEGGDLPLAVRLSPDPSAPGSARLEVRVDLSGLPPGTPPGSPWRLTLLAAPPDGTGAAEPGIERRSILLDAGAPGAQSASYQGAISLPPVGGGRLAVVLDRPDSGAWGGDVAALAAASTGPAGAADVAGSASPEVPAASERSASLPIPALPGARRPARGAGERAEGFGVRILRPAPGPAEGAVEVEAEVRVPERARVERVEFFWNDELAATLYAPPFRHRVVVPATPQVGYLRVAARLADGSSADDAVLMNGSAPAERLDIRLVELPVVVTDKSGKPVRGLTRADFRVRQNGRAQEISGFEDAGELPLTLGLAVDSSASMFIKLERVQRAAGTLLAEGLQRGDAALIVDFDSQPRLVERRTRDLVAAAAALGALKADGGTALWAGIVFSLAQLEGVEGRKALVVYSDGVGEEDKVSYRSCLRAARRSGIPLYLIVTNAEAARTAGGGFLLEPYAAKLERLAAAAGGRTWFVRPSEDLGAVYREILGELRSQYLLTFYPSEGPAAAFREVEVEVSRPGLKARTLSGYELR